jgi:predicted Zn-dependent peptidase
MIHIYNKTQSKITTIIAAFNAGSRIEKKQGFNAGISHMLEHCIFKGTDKRDTKQIIEDISMLGGYTNAFTSHEMVAYYIEVPYNNLEPALEILSDIVLNSTIPDEEFKKEREVVLEEEASSYDSVNGQMYKTYRDNFHKGYLSTPVIGTKDSINNFTAEEVRRFYKTNCTKDNLIVSVSSNYTKKYSLPLIEKYFGKPTGRVKKPQSFKPIKTYKNLGMTHEMTYPNIEHTYVWVSFPSLVKKDKRNVHLRVLSQILGGGMDSRLFREVREKRGLVYSIGCSNSASEQQGSFGISFSCRDKNVDEVLKIINEEVIRISQEEIDDKELIKVKNKSITAYYSAVEDSHTMTMNPIMKKMFRTPTIDEYSKLLEATSKADVQSVAKDVFKETPFILICRREGDSK